MRGVLNVDEVARSAGADQGFEFSGYAIAIAVAAEQHARRLAPQPLERPCPRAGVRDASSQGSAWICVAADAERAPPPAARATPRRQCHPRSWPAVNRAAWLIRRTRHPIT